jgi:hypothetical protein
MNRKQYNAARESIDGNGYRYTLRHADAEHRADLQRLHEIGQQIDHLLERQRWAANPDTSAANIIRLTTPAK